VLAIGAIAILASIGDEPTKGGSTTGVTVAELTFAERIAAMEDVQARRRAP